MGLTSVSRPGLGGFGPVGVRDREVRSGDKY
jgi:hypothetical protein